MGVSCVVFGYGMVFLLFLSFLFPLFFLSFMINGVGERAWLALVSFLHVVEAFGHFIMDEAYSVHRFYSYVCFGFTCLECALGEEVGYLRSGCCLYAHLPRYVVCYSVTLYIIGLDIERSCV